MSSVHEFPSPQNLNLAGKVDGTKWNYLVDWLQRSADVNIAASGGSYYAYNSEGAIISGPDIDVLTTIKAIVDSSTVPSGAVVKIQPGTYIAGEVRAGTTLKKDLNIFAYGVTIQAHTTAHTTVTMFDVRMPSPDTSNIVSLRVFGLTIDCADSGGTKRFGYGFGGYPKLLQLYDVGVENFDNYGLYAAGENVLAETGTGLTDSTVKLLGHTYFDQGASNSSNEAILVNGIKQLVIDGLRTNCWKVGYCAARYIYVHNLLSDFEGSNQAFGLGMQGEVIDVDGYTCIGGTTGSGMTIRPYESVHAGQQFLTNKRVSIKNVRMERSAAYNAGWESIIIETVSDTYGLGNITLENLHIDQGGIRVQSRTDTHGIIEGITLRDVHIGTLFQGSGGGWILKVVDNDVKRIMVDGCDTGSYINSTDGPLSFVATNSSCSFDMIDIKNITPMPSGTNMIRSTAASGKTLTMNVMRPLHGGRSGVVTGGLGTTVLKWFANYGTATVTSGATSVVVTHNLAWTPTINDIDLTPQGTWGSTTKWWPSSPTSTQFTINTDVAPGGSGLAFRWSIGM